MKSIFVSLALAVTAAASADDVTVTLNTSVNLDNSIFAFEDTTPGSSAQGAALLNNIPAGSYTQTFNLNGDLSQFASYRYTLLSTYTDDAHTGVVIGLNADAAQSAVGSSFESVFGVTESSIVSAIQGVYSGDFFTELVSLSTLQSFANDNLSKLPLGLSGGSLVAFSDGTNVGRLNAAPAAVPEPASMLALAGGAAALLRRRRR
jgi:hypothetical protein